MKVIEITNMLFSSRKAVYLQSNKLETFELNGICFYVLPYVTYKIKVSKTFPVIENDVIQFKSICVDSTIANNFGSFNGPSDLLIETLIQEGKIERADVKASSLLH